MTTKAKIALFRNAYAKWVKAQRNSDPWAGPATEPKPEEYGLSSPAERFVAERVIEQVNAAKG